MTSYAYSKVSQRDTESFAASSSSNANGNGSTVIETGMYLRDWRQALRTPPSYRLGNRTIRLQVSMVWPLAVLGLVVLFLIYVVTVIADLDTNSRVKGKDTWSSYLLKGYLSFIPAKGTITVSWDDVGPKQLKSSFSLKGRGMELSELVVFNGRLLTFDDRTGLVYAIEHDNVYPWLLLMDGDGKAASKGFKSEWATVKDQVLYVGSMGKEWTTSAGDFENNNPMYVKAITVHGEVYHLNWETNFKALRSSIGIEWPGYMIHESGEWSSELKRWVFLPRRCSKDRYNETRDEHMGCKYLLLADESFHSVKPVELKLDNVPATHGFSSFKFLPSTDDQIIVALSTEELNGRTSSYISAFRISGEVVMPETRIPTSYKFEGLEFI
ncbi:hypothetical protein quinque_010112 [Culex quinquefasciatus]